MDTLAKQLNAVPGVVGTLVCGSDGQVMAHAFPPVFDAAALSETGKALAESSAGLETVTGAIDMLDLRFASARVVVRQVAGAHLLCLCAPNMNLQPLTISTSVAARRLEKLVAERPATAKEAKPAGGELYRTLQRINAVIERRKIDGFKARGAIALKAGFGLGFIDANTPDEPEKITKLKESAAAVLGELF